MRAVIILTQNYKRKRGESHLVLTQIMQFGKLV